MHIATAQLQKQIESSTIIKTHVHSSKKYSQTRREEEDFSTAAGPALRRHCLSRTRTASPRHARMNRNQKRNQFPGSRGSVGQAGLAPLNLRYYYRHRPNAHNIGRHSIPRRPVGRSPVGWPPQYSTQVSQPVGHLSSWPLKQPGSHSQTAQNAPAHDRTTDNKNRN